MKSNEVLKMLRGAGVILEGHFVGTSGRHMATYINKDAAFSRPRLAASLAAELGSLFATHSIQVVIAPAIAGAILANRVAERLTALSSSKVEVLAVYAEKKDDGDFRIGRGYDALVRDSNVLVVEDVLTTGGSALKVIKAVRGLGGTVVGLGAICNRGGVTPSAVGNVPEFRSLVDVNFEDWQDTLCPLCKEHVPINTDVGHGRDFVAKKV